MRMTFFGVLYHWLHFDNFFALLNILNPGQRWEGTSSYQLNQMSPCGAFNRLHTNSTKLNLTTLPCALEAQGLDPILYHLEIQLAPICEPKEVILQIRGQVTQEAPKLEVVWNNDAEAFSH